MPTSSQKDLQQSKKRTQTCFFSWQCFFLALLLFLAFFLLLALLFFFWLFFSLWLCFFSSYLISFFKPPYFYFFFLIQISLYLWHTSTFLFPIYAFLFLRQKMMRFISLPSEDNQLPKNIGSPIKKI